VTADATGRSTVGRPLLIILGVVAVATVAYLLLAGGGSADVAAVDPAETGSPSEVALEPVVPADPSERPSEITAVEPTFEVFNARDPFDQLVSDAEVGGVADTQDTITTTPTDDTSPGTEPADDADGGDPTGGEPAQATVGTTTITLDDVFREDGVDMVVVEVNSSGYEVAEGDTVAGGLTVLDIAESCATMRFDGTRFILCEGDRIEK
jgi:hypothetical protein